MAVKEYEVLNSPHQDENRKVHQPGARIQSEHDLDVLFPNKFRLIRDNQVRPAPVKLEPAKEEVVQEGERVEGVEEDWQDVTDSKFPKAAAAGVTVLEKKGKFNLFYGKEREHPLNDRPMTKKEANKYIEEIEPTSAE